jgi:hypothetical protein
LWNQDLPYLTRYTLGSAIRSKFQEKIPLFYTGKVTSWSLAPPTQATGPCRCGLLPGLVWPHPHRVPGLIGGTLFQDWPNLVCMTSFQKVPLNADFHYTKRAHKDSISACEITHLMVHSHLMISQH